jgi:hypothetical protein
MDDERLRALLRELYSEGSRLTPRPLDVTRTRRRSVLRPVLGTCLAVALIAGAVVLVIPKTPGSPARVQPLDAGPDTGGPSAAPQTRHSPQPSLKIDTAPARPVPDAPAWVPAGAVLKARSTFAPTGSAVLSYQLAGAANAHAGTSGLLQVWVTPDADGKAKFSSSNPSADHGYVVRTVKGHRAILTVPLKGVGGFSVQWVAHQQLLTVSMARDRSPAGISGMSVDDLMRAAESIPDR